MAPSVFIVPGFCEGPGMFSSLVDALGRIGITAHTASLVTTGTKSPGNPTIRDNVAALREHLSRVVEEAGDAGVVAFLHSAGGRYGCSALADLSVKARKAKGLSGGVFLIVFLAGIVVDEEDPAQRSAVVMSSMEAAGLVTVADGQCNIAKPLEMFFNDISPEAAETWLAKLRPEPSEGWEIPLDYMGWKDIPSVYIVCESDAMLAVPLQEMFAALGGSSIVRIPAGHMAQVSQPDAVAKIVLEQAEKAKAVSS